MTRLARSIRMTPGAGTALIAALAVAVAAMAAPAAAKTGAEVPAEPRVQAAAPSAAQPGTWDRGARSFQITPYAWAAGLGGDLTVGAQTVRIDKSFSELLSDLDGAFFVSGFARQGRLVFLGDLSRSSSSRGGTLPAPAPGVPAEGRLRQLSATLAAGYRVADTPRASLDLLGGLRHWRLRASAQVPALGFAATRRASFTDPIIAARLNARLAPGWSGLVYADIGGFGVGSEFTGQIVATVNYAATDRLFLSAGYRHLHVDYRGGGLRADMRMSGPLLGATWRF